MAEAIQNPRRVPRAPARCEARCLLPGGGFWASDTNDFGPKGCQLHAPGPFKKGDPVKLVLTSERLPEDCSDGGVHSTRLTPMENVRCRPRFARRAHVLILLVPGRRRSQATHPA